MVISTYAKPNLWIGENLSFILKWSHWVITDHIADCPLFRISLYCRLCKVRTIGVVIFITKFKNTTVFKHTGSVNFHCFSLNADHIIAQLSDSCRLRIIVLSGRNAAAKVYVCFTVVIYQYRWVKAPFNFFTSRCLFCNQSFANWIFPGT